MKNLPKDAYFLTPRLNILGKGGEEKDQKILPSQDQMEEDVEVSRKLVAQIPLSIRTRRDMAIDYMNPTEELSKYIKSEDESPAFDWSTLTLIAPFDGIPKQTISLIQTARANYLKEENKYNSTWPENETPVPRGAPTQSDFKAMYEKNAAMVHQTSLDQTSSL